MNVFAQVKCYYAIFINCYTGVMGSQYALEIWNIFPGACNLCFVLWKGKKVRDPLFPKGERNVHGVV